MRNSKHETIADIVAEMRSNEFDDPSFNVYSLVAAPTLARGWADRIEAAVNQPVTNCNRLGNAKKMREALERCASMGEQIEKQLGSSEDTVYAFRGERCLAHNISECARAALDAPPRNCDVGTVEEQDARHSKWCRKYGIDGDMEVACAHQDMSCTLCALRWSQMPYEEGGEK